MEKNNNNHNGKVNGGRNPRLKGEVMHRHAESIRMVTIGSVSHKIPFLVFKLTVDVIFGVLGSILTLILAIFFYIPIRRETGGSLFFRQKRIGIHGKTFYIYKFRTMKANGASNQKMKNEVKGPAFKIADDPRVTPFGKFLRRTSIDEIPQFINILKGDMSVVGPRPPLPEEVDQYDAAFYKRLSIRPGVTGYWQVTSRNNTTHFDQIYHDDMYYLENAGILLDVKIMANTPRVMVTMHGR